MPRTIEKVLEARDIGKTFLGGSRRALGGVSLDLFRGEILSIVGPNGAGKSTLIQILLGLLRPDSGSLNILGVDAIAHRRLIAHRINYASTDLSLPYSLTVLENLKVYSLIYNLSDWKSRVDSTLQDFGLSAISGRKVGSLSTGQVARLGIAKALLTEPEILFLDEPTATLDPEVSGHLREFLRKKVIDTGMSLLYTSHNMREVERLSDRIILLGGGKIIKEGGIEDLLKNDSAADLEELFLDTVKKTSSW
ncbi:MAG: ABC transporter ATP-binding protein [Leptospirillum sp.]|jgi:ABC-2 type transport system ATP-binding protein|nr:ABC transporter ATP-binding protein [Nitrospiraceae bacterium]